VFNYFCFELKTCVIAANMNLHVCSLAENTNGPLIFMSKAESV